MNRKLSIHRALACAAAAALLAAGCRHGGVSAFAGGSHAPARSTTALPFAPRPLSGDGAALETARRVLGPAAARAVSFRAAGRDFIAAVRGVPHDTPDPLLADAEVGEDAYQVVVLERTPAGWEARTPALFVGDAVDHARRAWVDGKPRAPGPSRALEALWGVEDADGDGDPEVFAAQIGSGVCAYVVDLRVYDALSRDVYRLQVFSQVDGDRLDHGRGEFSPAATVRPAVKRWLMAKADAIAGAWRAGQAGKLSRAPSRARPLHFAGRSGSSCAPSPSRGARGRSAPEPAANG